MISNYSDPIVTLNQVYKASLAGNIPQLGACIIGPNYFVREYEDLGDSLRLDSDENYSKEKYSNSYTFATGLSARPFPAAGTYDLNIDYNNAKVFVKDAKLQYLLFSDTTSNSVVFSAEDTVSIVNKTSGLAVVLSGSKTKLLIPVLAGDGAIVTCGGNKYWCNVSGIIQDANKLYTKCVLSKNLNLTDNITNITFYKIADTYLNKLSITASLTSITIKPLAKAKTTINNIEDYYNVLGGAFYALYRVSSDKYSKKYGMAVGYDYLPDMLGKICPDNPLGIAVACALKESANNYVYFVSIDYDGSDTDKLVAAYTNAADLIADKDGIYGIVPCTSNPAVLKALLKFVNLQSSLLIPYFKYLYGSVDIPEYSLIVSGLTPQTVEAETTTTTVKFTGSPLVGIKNILKGDIVKFGQYTASVLQSNNKDSLILDGNYSQTLTTSSSVDIYQNLIGKNSDIIDTIILNKPYADKRGMLAFADLAVFEGYDIPNYCVAAALAGKRSGTYPHAPLSNVLMAAIITRLTHGFTSSQSKKLGSYGFWRIGLNLDGACVSRRQLTSAAKDDVNYDLQSIVCDIDSVCLALKTTGRSLVGSSNISDALLDILQTTLLNKLASFTVYASDLIGPQLLSASLISILQDAVNKDRIYASMLGLPPKPFNRFHMTFYMN